MNTLALDQSAPSAYNRLAELNDEVEATATAAGLEPLTIHLIKIRSSQLNGCAFCLRMHTREAIADGETEDRLSLVAAWRESDYFTAKERAALALAERTTAIGDRASVDEADYAELSPKEVAAVQWVAIVINSFNRVAISSGYKVRP